MMNNTSGDSQQRGPLTEQDREELAAANSLIRKLNGVQSMATFNVVSYMICLMLSVLIAIFSPPSWVAVGILTVLILIETRGKNLFAQLNPKGGRLLIWNQILLLTVITFYCAYQILYTYQHPENYSEISRQLPQYKGMIEDMVMPMTLGFYGIVFLLSLLFQGMTARYYYSRMKILTQYLADTPHWIVELQQAQR